jgi:hypothetical protein
MIVSQQQARLSYQSKRPILPAKSVQFSHQPHVHGPHCDHDPHSKPESKSQNLIVRFFDSIYQWFKEALTGLWTDLFGKNKEVHQHNEHCDHSSHASKKNPHQH